MELKKSIDLCKIDEEKRLVYGIVYSPDEIDAQDDWANAEEIEKACHTFLEKFRDISYMHQGLINEKAKIVECYIMPITFDFGKQQVKKGSWVLVTKIIDDEVWEQVKSGELTGYSLEGTCEG